MIDPKNPQISNLNEIGAYNGLPLTAPPWWGGAALGDTKILHCHRTFAGVQNFRTIGQLEVGEN